MLGQYIGILLFGIAILIYKIFKERKQVRKNNLVIKAYRDIDSLSNAIINYLKHYKQLPIVDKDSDKQYGLFPVLHGCKTDFGVPFHPLAAEFNPDMINFVEAFGNSMPTDPWGNPYNIYLDRDKDGVIEIRHETATNEERIIRINRSVAIWSNGPDGINSWGDGDDITSWNR